MGFLKPAWQSKNVDKAIAAVNKITDESTLYQIFQESPSVLVRKAALENMSNMFFLRSSALNDSSEALRDVAHRRLVSLIMSLESVDTIRNIIIDSTFPIQVREAALKNLAERVEQEELVNLIIAIGSEYPETRVVPWANNQSLCRFALSWIANQDLLARIAKQVDAHSLGLEATRRIDQSDCLADVARYAENQLVRIAACKKGTGHAKQEISPTACTVCTLCGWENHTHQWELVDASVCLNVCTVCGKTENIHEFDEGTRIPGTVQERGRDREEWDEKYICQKCGFENIVPQWDYTDW